MQKVCILIPAYNEVKTIGEIVKKLKDFGFDVVVIDDGSTDATSELAHEAGAFVIRHNFNKGKGASIKEGIQYILSKPYNAAVIMDGDGQHDPEEIFKFLKRAEENRTHFIIGNRMPRPACMPLVRLITNKIMSMVISAICRQHIPDTQCGYKYIRTDVLKTLNLSSSKYEIESEILIEAAQSGTKIDSMAIKSIYMKERSEIKPFIDTVRFICLLINKIFKRNTE